MAASASWVVNGVVRIVWDDAAQTVTEYAANGTTVVSTRGYTQAELDAKAERATRAQQQVNYVTYQQQIAAGITALQADVTTLQGVPGIADATINANPANYLKSLAAITLRLENAVIGLAKIVSGSLS